MSRNSKDVIDRLRKDKRTIRLKEMFKDSPAFKIPVDNLNREIDGLHATRTSRSLNPAEEKFVDSLLRAAATEARTRSRLAEINVECTRSVTVLKTAVKSLERHLLETYASDFRTFPNKESRQAILDRALVSFHRYIDSVSLVQETALIIIQDIDKAGYTLRLIGDLLKPSSGGRELTI